MIETVTVTPQSDHNSDGDPVAPGDPIQLRALEIAPGNLLINYGMGGDLVDVQFTVFLPLRSRTDIDTWTATETLVKTGDLITVRDKPCVALVQVWKASRGNRGGIAVLARSRTGKAA